MAVGTVFFSYLTLSGVIAFWPTGTGEETSTIL
jgi:hypothetical protein